MHIRTVSGPIAPEELGITLGHEHLLIDLRGLWENPPVERAYLIDQEPTLENLGALLRNPYDSKPNLLIDDIELSIAELLRYQAAGGQAVIDMTTVGLAPKPHELQNIAQRTDIHVVAGCGYYRQPLVDQSLHGRSIEEIADDLLCWLNEGMYGTTIRAGLMGELGTSAPIYPFEERQLRAAARVQQQTGASINVHPLIWGHEHLHILDILEAEGADLSRVAISHCDELIEPEWHARIAERGAVLCFDTFGSETYFDRGFAQEPRDTDRIACALQLLEKGYEAQLMLAHDICTRTQFHRYGGWGWDHLLSNIIPRLRHAGVSQQELDTIFIETPKRLLTLQEEKYALP
ncbi:MAG: phosphotriesterase-related protein [Ktedonobacteraceae bacterium]